MPPLPPPRGIYNLHFRHTRRHRCVQAYDRTNFYSRRDTVLWSRTGWTYKHVTTQDYRLHTDCQCSNKKKIRTLFKVQKERLATGHDVKMPFSKPSNKHYEKKERLSVSIVNVSSTCWCYPWPQRAQLNKPLFFFLLLFSSFFCFRLKDPFDRCFEEGFCALIKIALFLVVSYWKAFILKPLPELITVTWKELRPGNF